jgi:hypothetical protein
MPVTEDHMEELKRAYGVFGIPFSASALSIKQTYRQLVRRWHPDHYPSGSAPQAEATQMAKLIINGAYSKIEHAPLRYYFGADSLGRGGNHARAHPPANESNGPSGEVLFPKTDRLEFWVRFACGALLGVFASFSLVIYLFERPTVLALCTATVVFGFAVASARFGDKFWRSVFRYWWLWS